MLVSGAHAASLRAVNYARTLGLADTRAVFFAFDSEEADVSGATGRRGMRASARDRGGAVQGPRRPVAPLPARITAEPDAVAVVIMPELIFSGPQRFLHNQRALYIKRLLLFEPRVILTSVPYRLG